MYIVFSFGFLDNNRLDILKGFKLEFKGIGRTRTNTLSEALRMLH